MDKTIYSDLELPVFIQWLNETIKRGLAKGPVVVSLGREKRSLDQNNKLWPMLTDISKQKKWFGESFKPEDWKDIITGAWKQQKAVPGINGGVVFFGIRTSKLNKQEFSDLIEFMYFQGSEWGIKWSDESQRVYRESSGSL